MTGHVPKKANEIGCSRRVRCSFSRKSIRRLALHHLSRLNVVAECLALPLRLSLVGLEGLVILSSVALGYMWAGLVGCTAALVLSHTWLWILLLGEAVRKARLVMRTRGVKDGWETEEQRAKAVLEGYVKELRKTRRV